MMPMKPTAHRALFRGYLHFRKSFLRAVSSQADSHQIVLEHLTNENVPNGVVTLLTLNNPKANAMGSRMLSQLKDALNEIENGAATRCLVITSFSPKVFSAGADLKERATMTLEQTEAFVTELRTAMHRLSQLKVPSIAAIEGVAVGGGLELALAADLRVASRTATLGLPETSLAIVPGAGGTQRLSRLIGMGRAKEMVFTAERIDGTKAMEYGVVQHVVEPGQALEKSMEIAWKIAKNGPIAISAAKWAMDKGIDAATIQEALEIERQGYARVIPTQDRLEGLAAFKEGRPPEYKGK